MSTWCFYVLAIVSSGALNIRVCNCLLELEFSSFLDIYPGVGLLGHMVVIVLIFFLKNLHNVFHSSCTNFLSHLVKEGCIFSTPSPAFIICRLFDDSHTEQCEVIPHYGFDLHFSNI